jgi:hypothetical protein
MVTGHFAVINSLLYVYLTMVARLGETDLKGWTLVEYAG